MDIKQQIADRIKKANNILVTVSANPSVDQLAACIGLTLVCNKLGKHATAVFSGQVPSVIEFLQPEKTIEKNTDSLRDFIIALDKSKADKLRYKVEDKVVKIFITPYRTSISEKDLDFSQGDFNVDVIVALGVHNQADLDQAITAHGRILHDATVATINVAPGGDLGAMNWLDAGGSSLSELCTELSDALDQKLIDGQIATAFLTGIVAETGRFSNAKTSPQTMSISAELMSLGANQQLVASKLEAPAPAKLAAPAAAPLAQTPPPKNDDGTLEIQHMEEAAPAEPTPAAPPQIHIDEHGELQPPDAAKMHASPANAVPPAPQLSQGPRLITEPPTFASELTANASTEDDEQPSGNPLGLPTVEGPTPLLNRTPLLSSSEPVAPIGRTIEPPKESEPEKPADVPAESVAPPPAMPFVSSMPPSTPAPAPAPAPPVAPQPVEPTPLVPAPSTSPLAPALQPQTPAQPETLSQIERDVHSPHLTDVQPPIAPSLPPAAAPAVPASPFAQPTTLPPVSTPFAPPAPAASAPFSPPASATPWTPPLNPFAAPASTPATPVPAAANVDEQTEAAANVEDARDAVNRALSQAAPTAPEPIQALNAQALGGPLHDDSTTQPAAPPLPGAISPSQPADGPADQTAPPPVPPPMMPQ